MSPHSRVKWLGGVPTFFFSFRTRKRVSLGGYLVGVTLSEPHTSGTALRTCVCMFACLLACLLAAIYRKFLMSTVEF